MWTQQQAIDLAAKVEKIAPQFGCHVALTGGCLYKHGERKDCDLLFYRIRQVEKIDFVCLFHSLLVIGFDQIAGLGWCFKSNYEGKPVDLFFPEEIGGEYVEGEDAPEKMVFKKNHDQTLDELLRMEGI